MWPWEHVAFGYLCYSLLRRGRGGGAPDDAAAVAVVVAAVLPDAVDKTLSWGLGLFPAGYSVAHSVLVAVPVALAALVVGRRRDRVAVSIALVVGHWSHLVGDVVYPAFLGRGLAVERILWPLVTLPSYDTRLGLVRRTVRYLAAYADAAAAGRLGGLILLEAGFLLAVFALWLFDGAPGLRGLWRVLGVGASR